ncbi:hypothetical protein EOL70_13210 [Leucothrix sargassi]|nr:hypothetical protein EOL70_13210 [Leucothrix sargassi]
MVKWPVIVSYNNHHELDYIESEQAWDEYHRGNAHVLDEHCIVIDILGQSYVNDVTTNGFLERDLYSVEKVTELVRLHASELGNCCISKMFFSDVEQAVKSVKDIEDQT